ncbi:MAG: PilZ domain-containing protein [Spirochaetaceae bacterium]|nr:MAG: PilZ domain-containing protein [Spirochaetaceae bacterium]
MDFGREVFFLYPPSVLQEQLLSIVVQAEYEVYLLKDHVRARKVLRDYPDAIVFINIDEKIRDGTWEQWVAEMMTDPQTASVRVGILSYNNDSQLARRYLLELSVPCGFIQLKLGITESARILLKVLEANEARGQRKHVRAVIPPGAKVWFNVRSGRSIYRGRIRDLSAVGMACYFDDPVPWEVSDELADLQLNLRGQPVSLSGTVAGVRTTDTGRLFVIMFASVDSATRLRLYRFIHTTLQAAMDARIAAVQP